MKKSVLARPNLKVFLVGAMLVAVIEHIAINGNSFAPFQVQARPTPGLSPAAAYLESLLEQSLKEPSPELFMQISAIYERQGDLKRAIQFLRKSEMMAQIGGW